MKKFLTFVLVLAMVMSVSSFAMAAGGSISGYGTEAEPFLIEDAADLAAFRNAVNGGNNYADQYVKLANSFSLTGEWTPIGNGTRSDSSYLGNAFKGVFDGGNYTISGLTITNAAEKDDAIGLFGVVDGGTVKNLTLSGVSINGTLNKNAGAAIGLMVNGATADSITVSGSVSAVDGVGGVVGRMTISGTISNCVNNATVTATGSGGGAGGIVGKAYYTGEGKKMTISGCINNGAVTSGYAAGGIVGLSAADVADCKNIANITAAIEAGGIVGEQVNRGTVSGNTNSGTVSNNGSGGTAYGGIIGWIRYQTNTSNYPSAANEVITVSNNTNSGSISASGASLGSGGIVGSVYNQAKVTGNTNTAAAITGGTFAAGIVGGAQPANDNVVIDGATITASNNVSTTAASAITANCVASDMYNNAADTFVNEENSDAWVAQIGSTKYATLQAAVDAAQNDDTITLLDDCSGNGIVIDKSITIDFDGHTYTVDADPLAGSEGTKTQAFQILKGNTVTLKDGTLSSSKAKMLIQNYANLSLENMKLDGTESSVMQYVLSNNAGNVIIDGTTIDAPTNGVAFDVYYWPSGSYTTPPSVTVKGNSVINGKVEVGDDGTDTTGNEAHKLTIEGGKINGEISDDTSGKADITISGGTFSEKPEDAWIADGMKAEQGTGNTMWGVVAANPAPSDPGTSGDPTVTPTPDTKPSGSGISVKYNGGNSFSTSNPAVPTGVEIDGVPVTFNGNGSNFTVGCISSDAKWVTVRWNSTTVTTNFTPDGLVECTTVSIPKTGDMSIWAAIAQFLGF